MKESVLLYPTISENPSSWEYAWFQLPYSLPGIFTFIIGLVLFYVSLVAVLRKPKEERTFYTYLALCFLGNGFLGLVLALRAMVLDKELLLWWNNYLYICVMLLSPSGLYISYKITDKKYKSLLIFTVLCWITYFFGVIDVFRFHSFKNEWIEYPFGSYPKANLFISLWGIIPSIGCLFFIIPSSIRYAIQNKSNVIITVILGLNLIFFLPITNLPSILGYKVYPGASFLFIPMLIFAYGVFRSDFLDLNDLIFQKGGLFYIITVFFIVLFTVLFLCVIAFLKPTSSIFYSQPYFLVPLLSGLFIFILAIFVAGSNPNEKLNIMAALSLVITGSFMIALTAVALKLSLIISHRIDQLCYLLICLAPSVQLRFALMIMRLPVPKYMRLIDTASLGFVVLSQTPFFFGKGIYSYYFGYISQSGIGISLFALLCFISIGLGLYYWFKNRLKETSQMIGLVVLSFGVGGLLTLFNLPATMGFEIYPIGTMQWIPACIIAYSIIKYVSLQVKSEAIAIGNRVSILVVTAVPILIIGYYISLSGEIPFVPKVLHIALAGSPLLIAFYALTFILTRPISVKLDHNIQSLVKEKEISEQAKTEIEVLNYFTYLINSKSNLKDIFIEISMFMYAKHSIKGAWLFLPDEKKEHLYAFKAYSYDKVSQEQYDYMMNLKAPLNEMGGMLYLTYKRKKKLYLPKIKKFEFEIDKKMVETLSIKSFFLVPLVSKDECVGIFGFTNFVSEMKLSKKEIESISNLCFQIAGVIETNHLLQQVDKQKQETEFLNTITKDINSVSTLIDIMTYVIYHLEEKYGRMTFWLLVTDKKNQKLTTLSYNSPKLVSEIMYYFKGLSIPIDENAGLIFQVYKTQTHHYSKVSETANLTELEKELATKGNWENMYYLPLVVYEEVVGILFLDKVGGFSQDEQIQFQRISDQIAGAIQNAQLLKETEVAKEEADTERQKSEKLLLNILPKDVAKELKEKGFAEPVLFESVSVLFTDFKGFTQIAEGLTPKELVEELDRCFSYFDALMERYGLEKLKTIGDSYMCAGGIPRRNTTHAIDCVLAALEIQGIMKQMKELKEMAGKPYWELRLGIHSGSLVAGVIGEKKFAYDVWGDTVNTASRMESSGTPGKVNISGATYELVKELFECEYRGKVKAKNKGEVEMYYVNGIKREYSKDEMGRVPNVKFWERYGVVK